MRHFLAHAVLTPLLLTGGTAVEPENAAAGPPDPQRGALLYRIHCQNCHGRAGVGDGPMATLLTGRPADLTALTSDEDGAFPTPAVRALIDGRDQVTEHDRREMPVWGMTLRENSRDHVRESDVEARINDLVAYLEAIQARK